MHKYVRGLIQVYAWYLLDEQKRVPDKMKLTEVWVLHKLLRIYKAVSMHSLLPCVYFDALA